MYYACRSFLRNSYLLRLCQLIFCIAFYASAGARQPVYTSQQVFTVDDGLPQSFISGITQDKDGFLWLSTLDGLARYDGRKFRIFRYNNADSSGLRANTIYNMASPGNNIISLFYDGIMTDDFNMQSFKVTHNHSRSLLHNIPHAMWKMGNGYNSSGNWYFLMENHKGVGWLNQDTGKINYANTANGLLQQDTVMAIAEASDGRIYIVSKNGVQISDSAKKKFDFIQFKTGVKELPPATDVNVFYAINTIELLPPNKLTFLIEDTLIVMDLTRKTGVSYKVPYKPSRVIGEIPRLLKIDDAGTGWF